MEAHQYVKVILALVFLPTLVFGYDKDITHPFLTGEAIKLSEASFSQNFSGAEVQAIKTGSIEEDAGDRPLNHFYDPIRQAGLYGFVSSKSWAHGHNTGGNAYSWENAIYEYVYGDKAKGLNTLGHVVHLVQDATVPDHTRADNHYWHSTYESYAKVQTFVGSAEPIILDSLDAYFDQTASFSNGNFFSDDTILNGYQEPKIIKESKELGKDGNFRNYGYGKVGEKIVLIVNEIGNDGVIKKNYSIYDKNDNQVMSAYWSTLAPKAVGYSAGVIKLFLAEVEKERQTHALQKAREPWWQKLIAAAKLKIDQALATVKLSKDNPSAPTVIKTDLTATDSPAGTEEDLTPEQIRLKRLAVLENRLQSLKLELEALTEANQNQVVTVIRSINSTLAPIGLAPMAEVDDEDTSTTTATTTEEKLPDEPLAVNFSIDNCRFSLTTDPCLLVSTSSLNFSWAPTITGDYNYELLKSIRNPDDWRLWDKTVVYTGPAAAFTLGPEDFSDEIKWRVVIKATSTGEIVASSSEIMTVFSQRPLVINEIGWAGTSASDKDEWLELFNSSSQNINLDGFYLTNVANSTKINLSGTIGSNVYYLIERGSDEVVSNRSASLVDNLGADLSVKAFDLNNLGFKLWQKNDTGDVLIDETPTWNKTGNTPASLELNWLNRSALDSANWTDNPGCNEADGPCALDRTATTTFGTPGVINRDSIPRLI
ncbi:MAG: hypothetical protein WCW56_01405 [Candidatus Paceibacterota bacterium]|jgi:hypothetical protein